MTGHRVKLPLSTFALPLFALHRSRAQRPAQAPRRKGVRGSPPATTIQLARTPKKAKPSSAGEGGFGGLPRLWHNTARPRAKESRAQRPGRAQQKREFGGLPDYGDPARTHAEEGQAERCGRAERSGEGGFGGLPRLRQSDPNARRRRPSRAQRPGRAQR
jgi:hypothetical protein